MKDLFGIIYGYRFPQAEIQFCVKLVDYCLVDTYMNMLGITRLNTSAQVQKVHQFLIYSSFQPNSITPSIFMETFIIC